MQLARVNEMHAKSRDEKINAISASQDRRYKGDTHFCIFMMRDSVHRQSSELLAASRIANNPA